MNQITHCKIHPAIGIARVGNSPGEFFIGPELPYATPAPPGGYKDASGALKRQAARFRLFGYNAADQPVQELTAQDAQITWIAHLANKKAAWYNFEIAMDIPEAQDCARRNARVTGEDRKKLVIDPGGRSVTGKSHDGTSARFDTGTFFGKPVYLGELRTDEAGRLLVLGGHGASAPVEPGHTAYTFANNDGWHDDIADGPVSAEVLIGGQKVPVEPSWVIVAPPNYAPDIVSFQTLYDLIVDSFQNSWLPPAAKPSFASHVLPTLQQLGDAQWVNTGFQALFGWHAPHDFSRRTLLANLASPDPAFAALRQQLFHQFRDPGDLAVEASAWPPIYGDAAFTTPGTPRRMIALTPTQYARLRQWAHGDFVADWKPDAPAPPQGIDGVPLADRPHTLDKAALHFCMGGPFHPGCEMTWPMRRAVLYSGPFRIRRRPATQPEPDFGDVLKPATAISQTGPLAGSGPGDITRWMAVPWQTDTSSCRSGYRPEVDPYLPTFWPARVPNQVLSRASYEAVLDASRDVPARSAAFHTRSSWLRVLQGAHLTQINQMVSDFGKFGIVERQPGPSDTDAFPPVMYVESPPQIPGAVPPDHNMVAGPTEKTTRNRTDPPASG